MDKIKKGCKVRCINDYFSKNDTVELSELSLPKGNDIYSIREMITTRDEEAVLLKEIHNSIRGCYEPAFLKNRFEYYSE